MTKQDIIKPENLVYGKTKVLTDNIMHYCPGCSHGVIHKLIAEVIEEMGIQEKTIGIAPEVARYSLTTISTSICKKLLTVVLLLWQLLLNV